MRGNKVSADIFRTASQYPLIFVNKQGEVICETCAREKDFRELQEEFVWDVFYEGAPMQCDSCNEEIESAYGDPETEKERAEDIKHQQEADHRYNCRFRHDLTGQDEEVFNE